MTITDTGDVGIGTSSPSTRLHVAGGSATELRITTSDSLASTGAALVRFGGSNSATSGYVGFGGTANDYYNWNALSGASIFGTANTERMRIDSSGNLLVGTTSDGIFSPNNGFAFKPADTSAGGAVMAIGHATGTVSGYSYAVFNFAGGPIGSISQSGTTAVLYNTTSDYRLKDNVVPIVNALDRVQALKPVTYTWKAAPDEIGEGFIAHELAEICPQAVTGEKDAVNEDGSIKPQGIDTSFLVATLTAAIQEQQALIENLTTRLNALEGK
jgi:hypothetical protein